MKARCSHGAPWFRQCPWCDDYVHQCFAQQRNPRQIVIARPVSAYPFWRNMTRADVDALIKEEAGHIERQHQTIAAIRRLMQLDITPSA